MPDKPLLIYDGECRFCCRWIERWKLATGDKVDYEPSQTAAARYPEISGDDFAGAVQWIGVDGERKSGAAAALAALAHANGLGGAVQGLYERSTLFSRVAEGIYGMVARNRMTFSLLTRWLWGPDVRPPTYMVSSAWFLRVLGLIYLIAFLSFGAQLSGLIGDRGILPASSFFESVGKALGVGGWWMFPSFCWWGASEAALRWWCGAGVLVSALLVLGWARQLCLVFLWATYLSLTIAGQVFYQFQWDILLLEVGFLAIFLAPVGVHPSAGGNPPRIAHFLLIWLLFRLMFASGVVKLTSGDSSWADGSALDFHYFTQPLPTPLAWYAQHLPTGFQWFSVKMMFFIELVLPFFLFAPRRLRLLAVAGTAFLQILILLTGNYGFFNLLTLALCLLAVDDVVWKKPCPPSRDSRSRGYLPKLVLWPVAVALFCLSLVPLLGAFRSPMPWLAPLASLYEKVAPFRTINGYGLFAVMTRERREIIIQGSNDGVDWKTYDFRYKPGDPHRAPPVVAPYMPRLDWQMWFAALGRMEQNPWLANFLIRLMDGSPEVIQLLADNPFPGRPPKYVRALVDSYQFTSFSKKEQNGDWWQVEPMGIYCPEVSLGR